MGTVYLGETLEEGEQPEVAEQPAVHRVAIKLLHQHLIKEEDAYRRFLREAEIGISLCHPNVVRTYAAETTRIGERLMHFLVMEFVEGQTLRSLLQDLSQVPENLCRHIGREIVRALAAIHEAGAVHRDLKPENVLITPDHVVKVMDLGVALLTDEVIRLSQTGLFVGSLRYAAPEQLAAGGKKVDGRADMYALGVILYELSTGTHPIADGSFEGVIKQIMNRVPAPVRELKPELTPFFEEVLHRLLEKEPERRFNSAAELLSILEEGEEGAWWQDVTRAVRLAPPRPLKRLHVQRETSLHGREPEVERLSALYARACFGESQVVLVEGEAGIGKTRLVDEFVDQVVKADHGGLHFLFGGYPPGGAVFSAGALTSAFRQHFAGQDLDAALAHYLRESPLLAPSFAALLRGDISPAAAANLTGESLKAAFVAVIRALAAERPTVIVVEDLHFATEDGLALFASVGAGVSGHRVMLVGTARPGLSAGWLAEFLRIEHVSRIPLARLALEAQNRVLAEAMSSGELASDLGSEIAAKSEGNPFFMFEILRGLEEGGFLARGTDGHWIQSRPVTAIDVPSSVAKLIQARIVGLGDEARELLEAGSCWGHEFDPTLVAAALLRDPLRALREFARIERHHHLIRAVGRHYVFDHHQIQEALYGELLEPLREEYHALLATALEVREQAAAKDPKELKGDVAVALCEQFLRGTQPKHGVRYVDAALGHLIRAQRNAKAAELAARALVPSVGLTGEARLAVLIRRQGVLGRLGRRDEQRVVLGEALAVANAAGEPKMRARALAKWGHYLDQTAHFDEARAALLEAIELARSAGETSVEITALGSLGSALHNLGRYDEAKALHEECLARARETGNRREEQIALGDLGVLFNNIGRQDEALRFHEQSLALAIELDDRSSQATALGNIGNVLRTLGRFDEALDHHRRDMQLARDLGNRWREAGANGGMAAVLHSLGQFEESLAHLKRQLVLSKETRHRRSEAVGLGNIGILLLALGRYEEALRYNEQHHALAQELGYRLGETLALLNLSASYLFQGATQRAGELLELADKLCAQLGAKSVAIYLLMGHCELEQHKGDLQAAERYSHEALSLAKEINNPEIIAQALLTMGDLEARSGREVDAQDHLSEALTVATKIGAPSEIVLATVVLCSLPGSESVSSALASFAKYGGRISHRNRMTARYFLWKGTGDRTHLDEAHRLLMYLRDHSAPEYRETILERVPLHREICAAMGDRVDAASPVED